MVLVNTEQRTLQTDTVLLTHTWHLLQYPQRYLLQSKFVSIHIDLTDLLLSISCLDLFNFYKKKLRPILSIKVIDVGQG